LHSLRSSGRLSTQIGVHSIDIATGWSIRGKARWQGRGNHRRDQRYGAGWCKLFVDEGAYVFISGRRKDALDEAVELIGRNVTGVQADSADLDDLDRLFEIVKQEKGAIDVLWASAAWANRAGSARSRGAVRRRLLAERARHAVHGPKGAALFNDGGSIFMTGRTLRSGIPQLECVRGEQGRTVRLRTSVGVRTER